jgi:hypothetical protein
MYNAEFQLRFINALLKRPQIVSTLLWEPIIIKGLFNLIARAFYFIKLKV